MLRSHFRYTIYIAALIGFSVSKAGSYDDFFIAVKRDDPGRMQAVLAQGFDPNTVDPEGRSGFAAALRLGSTKVADLLVAQPGFDVNALNAAGESPLMLAAAKGDIALSQRLLERGARIDLPGWTPLHYAASGPSSELVALLLERGAAIDAASPNGSTSLMLAARYGSIDSAELLLARGADPHRRNQRDLTAADFAVEAGRDTLARMLRQRAGTPR
ncbi:MAG: ankyrin repeat domain-containing protein [Burkholderiaceae bacterium]